LRIRIRVQDPVPFRPLDPGWVKKQDPDPGMNNLDHISESLYALHGVKVLLPMCAGPYTMQTVALNNLAVNSYRNLVCLA
jgi:hypothetical protein